AGICTTRALKRTLLHIGTRFAALADALHHDVSKARVGLACGVFHRAPLGFVDFGEAHRGRVFDAVRHQGEVEDVAVGQGGGVDLGAADHPARLAGCCQRRLDRVVTFHALDAAPADHDVAPSRQGLFSDRLPGLAAHDDGRPHGHALEAPEVVGVVPRQRAAEADLAAFADGDDGAAHYTATLKVIAGCGA